MGDGQPTTPADALRQIIIGLEQGKQLGFMQDEDHPEGKWTLSAKRLSRYVVEHIDQKSTLDISQRCECILRDNVHSANFKIDWIISEGDSLTMVDSDELLLEFQMDELIQTNS